MGFRTLSAACLAVALGINGLKAAEKPATEALVDFQRDIRPILADKCYSCHGSDAEHRKGGLRLDVREAAIEGGESGEAALTPGKPEASELLRRVESDDPSERMPPHGSKKDLTAAEKLALRRWIAAGAKYQAHWGFVPPQRPELPEVKDAGWVRNEIDLPRRLIV
jgi:hypothetical protein